MIHIFCHWDLVIGISQNMSGPEHLAQALARLIALRGLARVRGESQLQQTWNQVAGERIANHTRALEIRRGILHIGVANAPMLGELASFHKHTLLAKLQTDHADLKIRDLKFKLKTDIKKSQAPNPNQFGNPPRRPAHWRRQRPDARGTGFVS